MPLVIGAVLLDLLYLLFWDLARQSSVNGQCTKNLLKRSTLTEERPKTPLQDSSDRQIDIIDSEDANPMTSTQMLLLLMTVDRIFIFGEVTIIFSMVRSPSQ